MRLNTSPLHYDTSQFCKIFLAFRVMSLLACTTISPEPLTVMSFPWIVIVPSFFMRMLALPVLIVI